MKLFLLGICLFVALVIWITFTLTSCKVNRNRLLGVTLPLEAQQLPEVTDIVTRFQRALRLCFPLLMLAALPMLLLPERLPSTYLIYLWCWVLLTSLLGERLYRRYNRELYSLKRQRGWLTGRQRIITVDTQVSCLKKTMPVSRWWFLPSVAIAVLSPVFAILSNPEFSYYGWGGSWIPMMLTLACVLMHHISATRPVRVYSKNSEINRACNFLYQRSWSICWVVCSLLESIGGSLLFVLLLLYPDGSAEVWTLSLSLSLLSTVSVFVALMYTYDHIRRGQNRLLDSQDTPVYIDEDEYWISGFYNNPNDRHVMVEKRDGTGFTFNLGTFWGKAVAYGTFLLVAGILIFSSVFLLLIDGSSFTLAVEGDSATISAPLYGTSFSLDQVEEVTVLDDLPEHHRTNGASTSAYDLGHYYVSGYGACTLFIHKNNPPYLVIRLPGNPLLLNGETPEQTQDYARMLGKQDLLMEAGTPS